VTNYMDNFLNYLESTTPEERLGRKPAEPQQGRHFPSGHMTDVTGGNGGPPRHQCGGCEVPITHERGEWRSVYTFSMWCPAGAK
jgi:hypothetical protein